MDTYWNVYTYMVIAQNSSVPNYKFFKHKNSKGKNSLCLTINVHGTLPADIFLVGVRLTDQSYPRLPQNKLSLSDFR